MDRRNIALIFAALAASLMFVAIFVDRAGPQCLPQTAFGIAPTPRPSAAVFKGVPEDLPILKALVKAGGSTEFEPFADVEEAYCRSQEWALGIEIAASALAALAVGLWTAGRRV